MPEQTQNWGKRITANSYQILASTKEENRYNKKTEIVNLNSILNMIKQVFLKQDSETARDRSPGLIFEVTKLYF